MRKTKMKRLIFMNCSCYELCITKAALLLFFHKHLYLEPSSVELKYICILSLSFSRVVGESWAPVLRTLLTQLDL